MEKTVEEKEILLQTQLAQVDALLEKAEKKLEEFHTLTYDLLGDKVTDERFSSTILDTIKQIQTIRIYDYNCVGLDDIQDCIDCFFDDEDCDDD